MTRRPLPLTISALAVALASPASGQRNSAQISDGPTVVATSSADSGEERRQSEGEVALSNAVVDREDQLRLLQSQDPKLAANKKLVYDMYRIVLQGGHAARAVEFISEDYIQHSPNVASGRQALIDFIKGSRPVRPLEDRIMLPLLNIIAERDMVMVVFERPEKDADGVTYLTSWFDLFRIENGLIAEHWDPALKSPEMVKFDPNSKRLN